MEPKASYVLCRAGCVTGFAAGRYAGARSDARGAAHPSGRATGFAGIVVRPRGVARRVMSRSSWAAGFAMRAGARWRGAGQHLP